MKSAVLFPYSYPSLSCATTYTHDDLIGVLPCQSFLLLLLHTMGHFLFLLLAEHVPAVVAQSVLELVPRLPAAPAGC